MDPSAHLSGRQQNEPSGSATDSSNDMSITLQAVNWFLLCLVVLILIARTVVKQVAYFKFEMDDALILLILAAACTQMVFAYISFKHGIGRASGRADDLTKALKFQYYSSFFYIFTIGLAKIAAASFNRVLSPRESDKKYVNLFSLLVCLWTFASLFAFAFTCGLPEPWNYVSDRCRSRLSMWLAYEVIDIVFEFLLIILPVRIVFRSGPSAMSKKVKYIMTFSARVVIVPIAVCRIVYLFQASDSSDVVYTEWTFNLCTQILLTLCVVTVSIPQVKMLLLMLESGLIRNDDLRRRGQEEIIGASGGVESLGSTQSILRPLFPRRKSSQQRSAEQSHTSRQESVRSVKALSQSLKKKASSLTT